MDLYLKACDLKYRFFTAHTRSHQKDLSLCQASEVVEDLIFLTDVANQKLVPWQAEIVLRKTS